MLDTAISITATDLKVTGMKKHRLGVDCAFYDTSSCVLTLAYDASRVRVDCIEDVLISHGVDLLKKEGSNNGT